MNDEKWLIDSGASYHVENNIYIFEENCIQYWENPVKSNTLPKGFLKNKKGNLKFNINDNNYMLLRRVFYIKYVCWNIISVNKFTNQYESENAMLSFGKKGIVV